VRGLDGKKEVVGDVCVSFFGGSVLIFVGVARGYSLSFCLQ